MNMAFKGIGAEGNAKVEAKADAKAKAGVKEKRVSKS